MERINLAKHVRTLAILPVTDAPVISCYQSLAAGRLADRSAFDDRVQSLRRGLSIQEQDCLRRRFGSYRGNVGNGIVAQFQRARRLLTCGRGAVFSAAAVSSAASKLDCRGQYAQHLSFGRTEGYLSSVRRHACDGRQHADSASQSGSSHRTDFGRSGRICGSVWDANGRRAIINATVRNALVSFSRMRSRS